MITLGLGGWRALITNYNIMEKKLSTLTLTVIYEAGIRPITVARKKIWNGMSIIGDAKLIKRFGKVGVILRKSM